MSAMMNEEVQLLNGDVWESPMGVRGMAQWIDEDDWILLSEPRASGYGGTRMEALHLSSGACRFTQSELYDWLQRNGWRKSNARIALQVA